MGYGIIPYRVGLERLQSRLGTQDEARKNKLRGVCLKKAKDIDNLGSVDTPPFMEIVEELLDGKATQTTGYLYWYAIKCFIDDLGIMLNNNQWYPASADELWKIGDFALYDIGAPMKIPQAEDFPVVFVLSKEKMTQQLPGTLEERIADQAQRTQFQNWIKEAQAYKQDLVLFYH